MLDLKIDISEVVEEMYMSESEANLLAKSCLSGLVQSYQKDLQSLANKELHQTRSIYLRGLYSEQVDPYTVVVGLRGFLPNAVEQGISAFDEKEGFQKSSKVSTSYHKDKNGNIIQGWYLTIPFRWAIPSSLGESEGFAGVMPLDVYNIAKQLVGSQQIPKSSLPLEYQILGKRPTVDLWNNVTMSEYTHKSTYFEGMQKSQMENNGGYVTFRRVSNLSESNSWINSGIEGRNLMQRALQELDVERIITIQRNKILNSLA